MEIENLRLQDEIDNYTEIAISSTEPEDKKKMWVKQSKNLFNFRDLERQAFGGGYLAIKDNVFTISGTCQGSNKDVFPILQDYLMNWDTTKPILADNYAVVGLYPVVENGFEGLENDDIAISWWTESDISASRTIVGSNPDTRFFSSESWSPLYGKTRLTWNIPSEIGSVQFTIQVVLKGEDATTYENPKDVEKDTFVRIGNGYSSILQDSIIQKNMLDMFYPVGSYYETSNSSFDPNVSWGGTWENMNDGTVLISEGAYWNTIAAQPGEKIGNVQTWLKINQIPSHTHSVNITAKSSGSHNHTFSGTTSSSGAHTHSPDGNTSHKPMQLSGFDNAFYKASDTAAFYYTRKNVQYDGPVTTSSSGSHTHTYSGTVASNGAHTHSVSGTTGSAGQSSPSPVNLYQPSLVVCRWHRTA